MKTRIRTLFLVVFALGIAHGAYAYKWPTNKSGQANNNNKQAAEGCLSASASIDLVVNNVRARINTGGDMWWDLQGDAEYFIPKNTQKTSMFSASLWIGGLDVNGQLKLAAQRYRGNGDDFWTGPLSTDGTASVDPETCDKYDRHYVINRSEVESFIAAYTETGGTLEGYDVPRIIKEYPAHGDLTKNQSYYLAPFKDVDGDGTYDWTKGDYPYYDFDNELCPRNLPPGTPIATTAEGNGILVDQVLKGDQTIWWVFNDKGNIHSETKGSPIGMEIRAQAFAFATNDEINNMTFYSYEIINRSTYRLTQTYFSQWVDTDLGDAWDDYVGCDVLRGLGYCYNGVDIDGKGKPQDYGAQPPAVGVDFFQGPYMDPDGIDNPAYDLNNPLINCGVAINGVNFGDGIVDNERFGMRRFVYHNNTGSGLGALQDPDIAPEYYNLLRGIWKDGENMRYWGLAHPSAGGTGPACDFMFPGDTDPCNWGTGGVPVNTSSGYWTEAQVGNPPYDRRFMQSAGPFTLEPGAVNYITVGIPWARASAGGPWASVELLRRVDDKCQSLFDNCFKVLDGPDAPELVIQELDRELIIFITNRKGISNNYTNEPEDYLEVDQTIVNVDGDSAFRFQGYQIFQVKDASVSVADLQNADMARLVAQCDIKDGVSKLVNYYYNEQIGGNVPVEEVNGADAGIVHSFRIFEDKFATGDKRLVNHKQYYYIGIAYAYNNFKDYIQDDLMFSDGQKQPYKAGRKGATGSISITTGIPHIPTPEAGGTIIHSEYGSQPKITRIEGQGNGGMSLDLTAESVNQILSGAPHFAANPEYKFNAGPVNVKVIDPLNVASGIFEIKFLPTPKGNVDSANWVLTNVETGEVWASEKSIRVGNEQLLLDIGLSVQIEQAKLPGDYVNNVDNGFIEGTIQYADSSKKWLLGIPDIDGFPEFNWIRSGSTVDAADANNNDYNCPSCVDPNENYERIINGSWAPYRLASRYEYGPAWNNAVSQNINSLDRLYSVDVVITPDRSKWTKCPVIEMCEDANSALAEGNRKKGDLRYGQLPGLPQGMGYFPGYAINVETGERLNMMFGEDSWLIGENGRDMIWNPTANYNTNLGEILMGGKHWIYIMGHNGDTYNSSLGVTIDCPAYDEGEWLRSMLISDPSNPNYTVYKRFAYKDVMWVGSAIVDPSYLFKDPANMATEVKIRLRVTRPYRRYYSTTANAAANPKNDNYPMYSFSTYGLSTTKGDAGAAEGALSLINVVPNPYYAFSGYETNQLDNRVRITNLPEKCKISIYTVNGTLVRQYSKDDLSTSLDWDLKNYAGIPIAGGLYLIYVKVDGVGEKVIKWFGSLRPIDLNAF